MLWRRPFEAHFHDAIARVSKTLTDSLWGSFYIDLEFKDEGNAGDQYPQKKVTRIRCDVLLGLLQVRMSLAVVSLMLESKISVSSVRSTQG